MSRMADPGTGEGSGHRGSTQRETVKECSPWPRQAVVFLNGNFCLFASFTPLVLREDKFFMHEGSPDMQTCIVPREPGI